MMNAGVIHVASAGNNNQRHWCWIYDPHRLNGVEDDILIPMILEQSLVAFELQQVIRSG